MTEEHQNQETLTRPQKIENYVFLGLPKAGKTTYFTIMAQTLQNLAVRGDVMKFRYENDETANFIREGYAKITAREPDWPDKTQTYVEGYEFSLLQRIGVSILRLPWWIGCRQASICYHDYPGEAFVAAFENVESGTYKEQADEMKKRIRSAKGVFLLMDADKLFNGGDRNEMESSTRHLFRFILENNPRIKLAVLFNKIELFEGLAKDYNFREMFRDRYASAYAFLPPKSRFFDVYPIGKLDVNEKGDKVPSREFAPRGVLEPVQWMVGF